MTSNPMRFKLAAASLGLTVLLGACVTSGDSRPIADNDAHARRGTPANRAVQDGQLIDEILAAARKVTWEKKNFSGYSFVYDDSSRLLWATGMDRAASFSGASAWLAQLSIDSMDGWRMPSHPEFLGSRIFPENVKCNVPPYNSSYANEVYQGPGWTSTTNPYDAEQAYVISYSTGACGRHDEWHEYKSKSARIYAVRDIDELAAILINRQLSAEAQLVAVAKVLLREKIKYVSTPLTAPAEPEPARTKALKRGEFELAAEFAKRQQQEQARTDAETKRIAAAHQQAMRDFSTQKAAEDRREAAWRESLTTSATRQRLAEAALSEAFNLVFGSPTLKNVQYNPDKEAFDALLGGSRASILAATASQVTQRGGSSGSGFAKKSSYQNNEAVAAPPLAAQRWTMQLSIPTPLKEAQAFKGRLVDARLIPRLTFNWDNKQSRLSFAGYEIITNEVKQQREFASAKQANTVEAYQDFVDRYPKAPQAAQARQGIREIQARQERERQEQIARQKAEEKRRRAEEAAEAAAMRDRERLGCDNFYPGKTGKIMGKSFWFETVDGYIVRYVNKDRRLVTIQGVRGGTTLGEDQYHEISCNDLIYSTKW